MGSYFDFSAFNSSNGSKLKNAAPMPDFSNFSKQDIDMSADTYEYIGSNLVARGHAVIQLKNLQITADSVVINLNTKDMEASGHVIFSSRVTSTVDLTPSQYEAYLQDASVKVVMKNITTSATGRQMISTELTVNSAYLEADRVSGSLQTGAFQFRNFLIKAGYMYFRGYFAERYPNGRLKLFDSKMTTCEYEVDDNAHYEVSSKEMTLYPRDNNQGLFNYNADEGEHSVLAVNNFLRVWNVPVLWIPALYKPAYTNLFGIRFQFGGYSRWGTTLRTRKEFEFLDEPAIVKAAVMVDYYSKRGVGFGLTTDILTENSKTEFFGYFINDRNPYAYWDSDRGKVEDGYTDHEWFSRYGRYELPNNRYEFRLSNITHFTPRLDFRGMFDIISDYNFLQDYYKSRYDHDIQPPTYAALEYQGDRFSATLQTTIKVNSFDTVLQRLPELRFDFPRQELFKNIYYQGQTSVGYYNMNWRGYTFDREENPYIDFGRILTQEGMANMYPELMRKFGNDKAGAAKYLQERYPGKFDKYFNDAENYSSFRFDTLHAFYYPIKLFNALNLIPRAVGRFTAYSDSSKEEMSVEKLYSMYSADTLDSWPDSAMPVYNYDHKGGAQFRFAFELGLEGNMKFYRSWQEPKSAFFNIDGLRHVAVPYFNLVYIPRPTVDYENLYYFDEVDQIDEQAFIRIGMYNRLQTRRNDRIYDWVSLENYWDFYMSTSDDFNNIGDLGTILKVSPSENLTISTEILMDIGGNNEHNYHVYHNGEDDGRPGISASLFNRLNCSLTYKLTKDWVISASYNYTDAYTQRTAYSMGSTLTQISSATQFRSHLTRGQYAGLTLSFPGIIDDRLKGRFYVSYNVDDNLFDSLGISLRRDFHCWYAAVSVGCSSERDEDYDLKWPYYVNFTLGLSAMPGLAYTASHSSDSNN